MTPRIALIHAVTVAIAPVQDAFRQLWPEADCANILDDSLSIDLERDGVLTEAIKRRILALAEYGVATGAAGVLFTCSAFGEAIAAAAVQLPIPVLKPNEAMFEAALATGRRVGMLATFAPSVGSMEEEFREIAKANNKGATIEKLLRARCNGRLEGGKRPAHDRLIAQAAPRLAQCDVVLLAHFSTARAAPAVTAALDRPVLTSPGSAVSPN